MSHVVNVHYPTVPRIFDVSLPVESGGLTYPGNPEIRIEPHSSLRAGDGSNLSRLAMGSHTGTHVDAPLHFFDAGAAVDSLPLDVLIGPATVLAFPDDITSISADLLRGRLPAGLERLLLRTRNSGFVRERAFRGDFTFVAPDAAELLVSLGVRLVGVDYLSVEQFRSGHHRTHRTLLSNGVVIVEGLDLSGIEPGDYDLVCLPLRLRGLDGAPARAVLIRR